MLTLDWPFSSGALMKANMVVLGTNDQQRTMPVVSPPKASWKALPRRWWSGPTSSM